MGRIQLIVTYFLADVLFNKRLTLPNPLHPIDVHEDASVDDTVDIKME
jgi:hypothetical protein